MSNDVGVSAGLDESRRALVRDNLGLVAVNLRRIRKGTGPRSAREWEDSFQEGCLGLIRAAVDFDAARGIPFAAFALPRINNAMSVAHQTQSSLIRGPRTDSSRKRIRGDDGDDRHHPFPRTSSLTDRQVEHYSAGRRHDPGAADEFVGETIGDRLRRKYDRVVREAGAAEIAVGSNRGDRAALVDLIVRERLLVPAEEAKRSLRRIAKETNSSYGRVANCERKLAAAIRVALSADPEFRTLQRFLRKDSSGPGRPIDERLERELARDSAAEFLERFRAADRTGRARLLQELLAFSSGEWDGWIGARFAELSTDQREEILRRSTSADSTSGETTAGKERGLKTETRGLDRHQ